MDLLQFLKYMVSFSPPWFYKAVSQGSVSTFYKAWNWNSATVHTICTANYWGSQLRKTIHQLQLKKENLATVYVSDQWHLLSKFTLYVLNRDNWSTLISRRRSPKRPALGHLASLNRSMQVISARKENPWLNLCSIVLQRVSVGF